MPSDPDSRPAGDLAPRFDGVVLAAIALLVYGLLAQDTLYGQDGRFQMVQSLGGSDTHAWHFSFKPLLGVLHAMILPFGGTIHTAGVAMSAVGTALGVLLSHGAFRCLALSRRDAAMATSLVATAPAVLFFATVVEMHGAFFATAGLTFLAMTRYVVSVGSASAVLLGLSTAVSYLPHASGLMMPLVLWPIAWVLAAERPGAPSWRRLLGTLTLALGVHLVAIWLLQSLVQALGFTLSVEKANAMLWRLPNEAGWGAWLIAQLERPWLPFLTVWNDWGRPFFPLSVAALAAIAERRGRRLLLASAVGWAALLAVTFVLLEEFSERGAYLLPVAWPAALLVVRSLRRSWQVAVLCIAIAVGVVEVTVHDEAVQGNAFGEGYAEVIGERAAFLLVGGNEEVDGLLLFVPEPDFFVPPGAQIPPALYAQAWKRIDKLIRDERAAGKEVWITAGGAGFLPGGDTGLVFGQMKKSYEFQTVEVAGFSGSKLVPR